jgi:threonyl-tRNA synthetase
MAIVPVFPSLDAYAVEIQKKMWAAGFQVDCDLDPGTTLNRKIRQNQLAQYNFIGGKSIIQFFYNLIFRFLVVGQQEQANGTINIRTRDNKQHGEFSIDEVIRRFKELADTRTNHAEDEFDTSSAGKNVAGATSKLQATTISQSNDEQE